MFFYPLHPSFNSVEILVSLFTRRALRHWPSGLRTLTFFNNKNGCNTFPVTVTLRRQTTMFHPLNLLKSVTPLLHFFLKNDRSFLKNHEILTIN